MSREIGKVLGTADAQPLDFWVAVPADEVVQLDDVVLVRRELKNGITVSLYGMVDMLVARHEGARLETDIFLASDGVLPLTHAVKAHVIVTRVEPEVFVPPLPGLDQVPVLTSDTLWGLRTLPRRLLVLGGGPIGCELAQAMARLGSQVTLVERAPRLLLREDPEVSALVAEAFAAEGIVLHLGHEALRFEPAAAGTPADGDGPVLLASRDGQTLRIGFDAVLVAVGRTANLRGYGLEALGLADGKTVEVNGWLQTRFPNVYAAGDVAGPYQFTHTAAHQAWYAAVNALLDPFKRFEADYRVIPWTVFTDPEVARVGLNETEARERGVAVEVTRYPLDDLDRAIADGSTRGFVKVLTPPGSDRILGATIVGEHAGELLAEFVLALRHGLGLNKILGTIHIYPTLAEANKYAAGEWKRAHAPARLLAWARRYHDWKRR